MNKQLALRLAETKVSSLEISDKVENVEEEKLNISFSAQFSEENKKAFLLSFDVQIAHKDNLLFKIVFNAIFNTNEEIDEEFMKSSFVSINAPAIAYPYLRAFVSSLMTISGYDHLILPTINFAAELENNRLEE